MEIRIATTPEELERVHQLRYQCYIEELGWKYEHADAGARALRDPMDAHGMVYYAEDEGRMVATYCVHFAGGFGLPEKWRSYYALERFADYPESSFSFSSRLMVVPELRGSSVVPRMLMKAYEEGWRRGARFNFCFCRPRLTDLYERLGFMRYKENIMEPAQGYMVPMVLINEDAEHLQAVRSPFLKICLAHRPCSQAARWFDRAFPGVRLSTTRPMLDPKAFWNEWAEAMNAEQVTLLRGFSEEERRALLQAGTVLRCRAGDTLLREGEAGHEMFLVLEGLARFSQAAPEGGRESQIGLAGQGEVFGEIALVARTKRSASVQAVTDLQVLVISQEFLHRAMRSRPDLALKLLYNLSHVLAQKLQTTTQQWQDSVKETRRLAEMLAAPARRAAAPIPSGRGSAADQDRTVIMRKI
jgi:CRP-like cAMP-binding protein